MIDGSGRVRPKFVPAPGRRSGVRDARRKIDRARRQIVGTGNSTRVTRRKAQAVIVWLAGCSADPGEATSAAIAGGSDESSSTAVADPLDSTTGLSLPDESSSSAGDQPWPDLPPLQPEPEATARVRVVSGPTNDAELVKTLKVARDEDAAERKVVLRLATNDLPDMAIGDRVAALAEAQVTTRCDVGQVAPGCGYDPEIGARIVLRGADDAGITLASATQTCTKGEHHCMFVFRPADTMTVVDESLECVATADCAIELEMWAWDSDARADGADNVLVGENEGNYLDNGEVKGDKARLMAVRERDTTDADRIEDEVTANGGISVPTDASSVLVYSLPLADVRAGEQFVIDAKVVTAVASRARVSSKMFVTREPTDTEGAAIDGVSPRMIGEHNGTNCSAGASPCTTRKVAVFEATEDLGDLYVNIVIRSAVPGGGTTDVEVARSEGWLRSVRYAGASRG